MRIDPDFLAEDAEGGLSAFDNKVALSMPLGRYGPHPRTFRDWNAMLLHTASRVTGVKVFSAWDGFTPGIRQQLAQALLDSEQEWLFWVDSDMTFTPSVVCQLLSRVVATPEITMLSGTARMRGGAKMPTLYQRADNGNLYCLRHWGREPFTVEAVGGFGTLIHRSVFEQVAAPWFTYVPPGYGDGDDISFCKRVRTAGIQIWVEPSAIFGHMGDIEVPGLPDKYI